MKLATFTYEGRTQAGLVEDQEILPLAGSSGRPLGLVEIIESGLDQLDALRAAAGKRGSRIALSAVRLEAPIPKPRKYLAIGGNYHAHLEEAKRAVPGFVVPEFQFWFNKQTSCIIGPYDAMVVPTVSDQFDYEGEMGIVIGKRCRKVKAADAQAVIAGYTVCNDASVRDYQRRSSGGMMGKSFDTHGPIGPWLTLGLSIEEAEYLQIRTWVNGELRQDGRTDDLVYRIGEMIEELTSVFTLEPGDVLSTGSPAGVGAGMIPPRFLKAGDVVRIEIERLGAIENPVVADEG